MIKIINLLYTDRILLYYYIISGDIIILYNITSYTMSYQILYNIKILTSTSKKKGKKKKLNKSYTIMFYIPKWGLNYL